MAKRYWLMKSEPGTYSIDNLARDGSTGWSGVRNFQARNFMRDEMKVGDGVLFYHSSAEPTGVAGIAVVCRDGYLDPTSEAGEPWAQVDVKFVEKFPAVVALDALKANPALKAMKVVQRGMRLSVQPVTADEWKEVLKMATGKKKRG